jgi:hypothetical protein
MPTHQFIHFSLFGVKPRAKLERWSCIDGITREGARVPGATRHLKYPAVPTVLFGISPLAAGAVAIERAARAVDTKGRRLRNDGAALLAAVASYPVSRADVEARDQPQERDLYRAWRADAVVWFRERFGSTLLTIVEHTDEDYLHLHAYAVPDLGADGRLRWAAIHPGRAALLAAEANGADKATSRAAYVGGMRELQDEFHAAVSARHGHARLGPRRRRLDRTTHLLRRDAERKQAERDRDYAQKRARMRDEVKAEVISRFGDVLAEARLDARTLAAARVVDAARIAELVAQNERLMEQMRELVGEPPAPGC